MCGCYFLVWVRSFVNTALLSSCGPFLRSLQTLLASNQPTLVLHRFLPHLLCPSVLSVCQRGFVVHLLLLIPCFVFRRSSTCKCPMSICLILPAPSFLDVYKAAELSHQIHGGPTFKPKSFSARFLPKSEMYMRSSFHYRSSYRKMISPLVGFLLSLSRAQSVANCKQEVRLECRCPGRL